MGEATEVRVWMDGQTDEAQFPSKHERGLSMMGLQKSILSKSLMLKGLRPSLGTCAWPCPST